MTEQKQNELTTTIKAVMNNNYTDKQIQDFSLWVDTIIIKEQKEDLF